MTKQKKEYFTFLVAEESQPDGWRETLKRTHGDYLISPLHEADSENNFRHFHVLYKHPAPITLDCAKNTIPEHIPINGYIEPVSAPRNLQRYFLHLDDLDKQQFPGVPFDLLDVINNFPVDLSRDFSKAQLQEQKRKIFSVIADNCIYEYSDLLDLLLLNDLDLFDYASNHTILFNTYLTSKREKFLSSR